MAKQINFTPIPEGSAICSVSPIVNCLLRDREEFVLSPSSPTATFREPSFVFLITHIPSGKRILFDLGMRCDWQAEFNEVLKGYANDYQSTILADVGDILRGANVDPNDVSAIIFSHEHWDHTGHIGSFPNAELVGGTATFADDLKAQIDASGRAKRAIDFEREASYPVGTFEKVIDYLGDGSIWLCYTPGHTEDHISALVRTSASPSAQYVLLGGDVASHPCQLCSLPSHDKFDLVVSVPSAPEEQMQYNPDLARDSIRRTKRLEQEENVMVVLAHDFTYWKAWRDNKDVMFPGTALGQWKEKGLKLAHEYDPMLYE